MKKTPALKSRKVQKMASEYRVNYKKAKPNRFAKKMKNKPVVVLLDEDVAKVFKTTEQVNSALRALISAMPKAKKSSAKVMTKTTPTKGKKTVIKMKGKK